MNALLNTRVKIVVAIGNYDYRTVSGDLFEVHGIQLVVHRKVKSRFLCRGFAVSDPKSGYQLAFGSTKAKAFTELRNRFETVGLEQIALMLARCPKAPVGMQEVYRKNKLTNIDCDFIDAIIQKIQKEAELTEEESKAVESVLVRNGEFAGMLVAHPPVAKQQLKSAAWNALMPSYKRQKRLSFTDENAKELFAKLVRITPLSMVDRNSYRNLMAKPTLKQA